MPEKKIIRAVFSAALLLFLLYTGGVCHSQSITGKVISGETGEALDNVLIELNGKRAGFSGDDGSFEIENSVKFPLKLEFKRLGFISRELYAENPVLNIEVILNDDNPGTEEIIVNFTLLNRDNILNSFYLNSGINTIDELLSRSPGLSVIKRGNYASEPVMRGLNSDRTSITLNGMKIQSACTDKMDPVTSYAETGNLESIEISKGSFSCGKCNTKQAGIDLKLKEAETTGKFKLSGSLSTGYYSVSSGKYADARLNAGTQLYGTTANFVYKSSGDYKTGSGNTVDYSGYNKINFTNSHILKPSKNFTVTAELLYDYAWDIGYPALTMDVKTAEAFVAGLQFNVNKPFKNLSSAEAKIYYNFVNHLMDDSHRNNRIKMDMPGWTITKGAYLLGRFNFSKFMADVKTDISVTTARAEMTMYVPGVIPMFMLTWPDVLKNDYSVSLNIKRDITKGIMAQLGGGISFINSSIQDKLGFGELSIFYPDFTGKDSRLAGSLNAGLKLMLPRDIMLNLNYAYVERDLSISEQYAFYIFNRQDAFDYIGDPFIKNEKMHQAELGAEYSAGRFKTSLNLFAYKFSDYILGIIDNSLSPMTEGAKGVKIYTNIPGAQIVGFESLVEAGITSELKLVNSIQYSRGTENDGSNLPQIPPLSGTLSLRYNRGLYGLQAEMIWAAEQNNPSVVYGETRTPSFAVFNLRASVNPIGRFTVSVGAENILNKAYYEHLDWQKIERPGRNFYITLKTEF